MATWEDTPEARADHAIGSLWGPRHEDEIARQVDIAIAEIGLDATGELIGWAHAMWVHNDQGRRNLVRALRHCLRRALESPAVPGGAR